jgi:hypothetical protein
LQADHPSPLLPSRLIKPGADPAALGDDVPTNDQPMQVGHQQSQSPVRKFPVLSASQLGQKSISAGDISEDPSDGDLADATSQLMIDESSSDTAPDSPFLSPSCFHRPPQPSHAPSPAAVTADYPKSILRASPLLPRRRDFFGRLAEAAAAILSPSKPQPAPKKPHT